MNEIKAIHRQAMERTDLALVARQQGEVDRALLFFNEAFELELQAASALIDRIDAEPTRSVLFRSAAALALDCNRIAEAEKLICTALIGNPPERIADELRDLLEQVHFKRHLDLRGVTLEEEEFQMSLSGRGIGYGLAPAESFFARAEKTETLLYRTAERKQKRPFRERGRLDKAIRESLELYVSVPRAASYAITFRVGKGEQESLPGFSVGEEVIDEFFDCLTLYTKGNEDQLKARIPDDAYFRNFVGLARSIAPDGDVVRQVGFTALRHGKVKEVQLVSTSENAPTPEFLSLPIVNKIATGAGEPIEVSGTLKFADSRKKNRDEIQVLDAGNVKHTVIVPPGMMGDIVKPLWDAEVIITGVQHGKKIVLSSIRPVKAI